MIWADLLSSKEQLESSNDRYKDIVLLALIMVFSTYNLHLSAKSVLDVECRL